LRISAFGDPITPTAPMGFFILALCATGIRTEGFTTASPQSMFQSATAFNLDVGS
jgi:hypothetical protein